MECFCEGVLWGHCAQGWILTGEMTQRIWNPIYTKHYWCWILYGVHICSFKAKKERQKWVSLSFVFFFCLCHFYFISPLFFVCHFYFISFLSLSSLWHLVHAYPAYFERMLDENVMIIILVCNVYLYSFFNLWYFIVENSIYRNQK